MTPQHKDEMAVTVIYLLLLVGSLAVLFAFDTLFVLYHYFSQLTGIQIDVHSWTE